MHLLLTKKKGNSLQLQNKISNGDQKPPRSAVKQQDTNKTQVYSKLLMEYSHITKPQTQQTHQKLPWIFRLASTYRCDVGNQVNHTSTVGKEHKRKGVRNEGIYKPSQQDKDAFIDFKHQHVKYRGKHKITCSPTHCHTKRQVSQSPHSMQFQPLRQKCQT